nr:hypothetical protein [Burkholderia cenocepacia]
MAVELEFETRAFEPNASELTALLTTLDNWPIAIEPVAEVPTFAPSPMATEEPPAAKVERPNASAFTPAELALLPIATPALPPPARACAPSPMA